jgi:hypothetical protein
MKVDDYKNNNLKNLPEIREDGDFIEVYFPRPLPTKLNLYLLFFLGRRRGNKIFLKKGCKRERVVGFRCHKADFDNLKMRL